MKGIRIAVSLLFLVLCSAEDEVTKGHDLRALPCPSPEDILPCVCTGDEEMNIDMDCSAVASEEELARVFSSNLPIPTFRKLTIEANPNIKVLRKGDLGIASFKEVHIAYGSLEEVESEAFAQSHVTLTSLYLGFNKLSSFPFQELPSFTSCYELFLEHNAFQNIPSLESSSLLLFYINNNFLRELPPGVFQGMSNLRKMDLSSNDLLQILPGTFSNLSRLKELYLADNLLSHISTGAVELPSDAFSKLDLSKNNISGIEVGGIIGLVDGYLDLSENYLTTLTEEVYRPLFEKSIEVYLAGNPLDCGCDLAWVITNPNFVGLLKDDPTCQNGTLISDLDPGMYDLC